MANSFGVISAPIGFSDITSVLGAASSDLGTLCKHDNINMWAKYKPLDSDVVGWLTEKQREQLHYGIDLHRDPNWNMLTVSNGKLVVNEGISWSYNQPAEWKRIADFIKLDDSGKPVDGFGYNHNAVEPVYITWPEKIEFDHGMSSDDQCVFNVVVAQSHGWNGNMMLSLSDIFGHSFAGVGDYYLTVGLYCVKSTGHTYAYSVSSDMQMKNFNGGSVNILIESKNLPSEMRQEGLEFVVAVFASESKHLPTGYNWPWSPGGERNIPLNFKEPYYKRFTMQLYKWYQGVVFSVKTRPSVTVTDANNKYTIKMTGSIVISISAPDTWRYGSGEMMVSYQRNGPNGQDGPYVLDSAKVVSSAIKGGTVDMTFNLGTNGKSFELPSGTEGGGAIVFMVYFSRGSGYLNSNIFNQSLDKDWVYEVGSVTYTLQNNHNTSGTWNTNFNNN